MNKIKSLLFVIFFLISFILIKFIFFPILFIYTFFILKKTHSAKSVIFIENFPIENAGYYYRAEAWVKRLKIDGYLAKTITLIDDKKTWDYYVIYHFNFFLIYTLWKRTFQLFEVLKFDVIIVRRELLFFNEYGDLFLEKFLMKVHPNVILDIDDDLGAAKEEPRRIVNLFGKLLFETGNKFNDSLLLYSKFIVGSDYLKSLVLNKNPKANIMILPTCVEYQEEDKSDFYLKDNQSPFVFGWTGISGNLHLLDFLIPIFNKFSEKYSFKLLIISGQVYNPTTTPKFEIVNIPWSLSDDIKNISKIDIGLMPLIDTISNRGKCGFKLIQYMSLGIPSIGQSITVNLDIIPNEKYGWLVKSELDWEEAIFEILNSPRENLKTIGANASVHINKKYSFDANYNELKNYLAH